MVEGRATPASAVGDNLAADDDERLLNPATGEEKGKWTSRRRAAMRNDAAFWCLGLVNNVLYVIMMAFAKDILPSAVGIVFLSMAVPTMVSKVSAPYWFHRVPYDARVIAASMLMVLSFWTVACGAKTWIQLLGLAFLSLQGGFSEASCLALASLYDTPRALTAWSSGCGFAGMFGYAWVYFFQFVLGISLRSTLLTAQFLVVAWLLAYFVLLVDPHDSVVGDLSSDASGSINTGEVFGRNYAPLKSSSSPRLISRGGQASGSGRHSIVDDVEGREGWGEGQPFGDDTIPTPTSSVQPSLDVQQGNMEGKPHVTVMTMRERLFFTLSLWRFMVPLTLVYFAEYTIQTGPWSAIGFPVTSKEARKRFYEYANWSYQGGVFVSRSSGMILRLSALALWILPAVQLLMLFFFYLVAVEHFWYNNGLLPLCFGVGLVGGLGYVNAFRLVAEAVRPELKELALASASVGDSCGVMVSDIAGAFLQNYLYRRNGISD